MTIAEIHCPECGGDQVEICTPPLVGGVDSEGDVYAIEPPSSWVCMNDACRANGWDAAGDLCFVEVSELVEQAA